MKRAILPLSILPLAAMQPAFADTLVSVHGGVIPLSGNSIVTFGLLSILLGVVVYRVYIKNK